MSYTIEKPFRVLRDGHTGPLAPDGVLGIDPGVDVGWAYLDRDGQFQRGDVIDVRGFEKRHWDLLQVVSGLVAAFRPRLVVMEQDFTGGGAFMTSSGHLRGAIKAAVEGKGVPWREINPMSARKATTGHGRLTDRELRQVVCGHFGLPERVQIGGKGPWLVIPSHIIDAAVTAWGSIVLAS